MGADHDGRTERLELADATVREWEAVVLDVDPDGIERMRGFRIKKGGGTFVFVDRDLDERLCERRLGGGG